MISLGQVDIHNWKDCCCLSVADSDRLYVRTSEGILAKAYAYGSLSEFYSVYF